MNLKIENAQQSEENAKHLDDAKESYFSNSKVLDFQNIDQYNDSNNFASFYALNRLSNHLENRASYNQNSQSVILMQKYKRQKMIRTVFFYIYLIITVFQRPTWCNFVDYQVKSMLFQEYCSIYNGQKLPTMVNFYLPISLYYCIEILIVLYLCLSKVFKATILGSESKKRAAIVQLFITFLIIVNDVTVMILENNSPINISLLMKPILIVLQKRTLRATIFHYCQIVNKGKEIYYLMIFSLIFFAGLGSAIFQQKENVPSESTIQQCIVIILFVLQTTVNSPDIYLPYYGESRGYVAYFILFQFINTTLIINFVLAFFYSSYKDLMQKETKQILSKYNHRFSLKTQKFFRTRTGSDITRLADLSSLDNEISRSIYQILDNRFYEIFIEIISTLSFIMIFFTITNVKLWILLICNSIMFGECLLLIYYTGKRRIWRKKSLIIEFIFSSSILFLIILNMLGYHDQKILLVLLCYRLLRGCRWLLKNKSFTVLIISITSTFQYIVQLFGALFILFMLFTAVGQLLFGGRIFFSDENQVHYELANFNDFLSGMCTCWFLLIINNWNVISYNYAKIFNTDLVYIFFISFYIVVVLFTLNVTMALLIEYIVQKLNVKNQTDASSQEPQDEMLSNQQSLK
ncbi:unnamed protein product (macronuclear) [Paramecium tetraurelia]|uniref:Ion transport domain-containing protein n=1 Tax=Paramecium tetraurelia TaxID=5888 RepID=A0CNH5_PARTE|nr:uncharacterized protein GSPATT00008784001 [Paramecium tetraurelia]CAK72342.1 unnamed protein product [Paramecium tetraurelia]|eukprot:XP_001439739.1 hypothetical protein (macronuclear) [Paramecium tetraurelia strain d4-2]